MITKELVDFIQQNIAQNKTEQKIREILMSEGGWQESEIEGAFQLIRKIKARKLRTRFMIGIVAVLILGGVYFFINAMSNFSDPILLKLVELDNIENEDLLVVDVQEDHSQESLDDATPLEGDSVGNQQDDVIPVTNDSNNTKKVTQNTKSVSCGVGSMAPLFETNHNSSADDAVLQCLGERILAGCQESSAIFRTTGSPDYEVRAYKEGHVCMFELKIQSESMSCPVYLAYDLDFEASEQQNTIITKPLDTSHPITFAGGLLRYTNSYVFLKNEYNEKIINSARGCIGNLVSNRISKRQLLVSESLRSNITTPIIASLPMSYLYQDEHGSYNNVCPYLFSQDQKLGDIQATCYDSVDSFALSAPLPETGFFCIDTDDFRGEITQNISGPGCR
jgi:hypothetical protein